MSKLTVFKICIQFSFSTKVLILGLEIGADFVIISLKIDLILSRSDEENTFPILLVTIGGRFHCCLLPRQGISGRAAASSLVLKGALKSR